jgi:prepilin-type N-terminal cleavage/methylation domain-containing protein
MQAMKYNRNSLPRPGFTLMELLVVIAIIAILTGLTVAGVMMLYSRGPQAQASSEIAQLNVAMAAARSSLSNNNGLPSTIVLREDMNYGSATDPNYAALKRIWPRIPLGPLSSSTTPPFIDWNGNGSGDYGQAWTLQGHHALVFWLGGIPVPGGGTKGFANDISNPSNTSATFIQPFYPNFNAARLQADSTVGGMFYYKDPYGTGVPYIYFDSSNYGTTDLGVSPYFVLGTSPPQFLNRNSFQIISAGKNGVFGPGGAWNPATGSSPGSPGADDQSNFSANVLGAAQN